MVAASKLFRECLEHRQCYNDLIHEDTCLVNALRDIYRIPISNFKYFGPIIILSLLLKARKINKKLLKSSLRYYAELVLCGAMHGFSISISICIFRQLFGKFKYYWMLQMPSVVGGILLPLYATHRVLQLFQTSIAQCTIESFLIRRNNAVTKAISNSIHLQALIFMCCSALILYGKQNQATQNFWFVMPEPRSSKTERSGAKEAETNKNISAIICDHTEYSCERYLYEGIRNYLAIGFTIDVFQMLRTVIPPGAHSFKQKLLGKLRGFQMASTGFLASYIGIYRFTHCFLNRKRKKSTQLNLLLAGFFGGASYIFLPKTTFLGYGIFLSIQTLWNLFEMRYQPEKPSDLVAFIKSIPYAKLLYPFFMSYLVTTFCYRKDYVSGLCAKILNGLANDKPIHINGNFVKAALAMEVQSRL